MGKARVQKQEEPQSVAWLSVMLDLLRFGVLGVAAALFLLGITAVLISAGVFGNSGGDHLVIAACLLGSLLGGVFAVRGRKGGALPVGLGLGLVLFLLLMTAGVLLYDTLPTLRSGGSVAGACLCGGGLAGVLAGKPKKKRRK